jgi:hypothetical protein
MLNKNVNGKTVEMSPAEEAEVRAGWDEASRPRTPQEQDDINDKKN